MNKDTLYKLIDIDTPADFAYFEQMADLMESDEEISEDQFADVLSEIDTDTAADLIENYFEDLSNAIPDEENDMVSLIDSVKQNLLLCTQNLDDVNVRADFSSQLYFFYDWFHKEGNASVDGKPCSIFEAVTEHRAEKLGAGEHRYDFTAGTGAYELEDISLSLGSYSKVDILNDKAEEDEH